MYGEEEEDEAQAAACNIKFLPSAQPSETHKHHTTDTSNNRPTEDRTTDNDC